MSPLECDSMEMAKGVYEDEEETREPEITIQKLAEIERQKEAEAQRTGAPRLDLGSRKL